MAVFKRGGVYWYKFEFRGERIRETTKQGNKRIAEQIEAARKTELAKGEVGLKDRDPAPTLKEFGPRFQKAIEIACAQKPATVQFYKAKLRLLLANAPFAESRLDRIDEAAIQAYVEQRSTGNSRRKKSLAPSSINRELATLKRLLRLASEWGEIQRVPKIRLLRGERHREFVLSHLQEAAYLAVLPSPLCDIAPLLLDTGLRDGEAVSLEWPQVRLEPAEDMKFGCVTVLSDKAKNSKARNVPLTERVATIFKKLGPKKAGLVYERPEGGPWAVTHLDHHARVREVLNLPEEFVLHSLRHTFGTRLGESGADAFKIQRLMGHSSITVSQRYVHPSDEGVKQAFERFMEWNRAATKSATVLATDDDMLQ
jgi:integrase